jgi:oxaloacetate decarboxylase beta subunit
VFIYLAVVKKFEPLLLIPIAFAMILTKQPAADMKLDATKAGEPWTASGVL